jgi:hypothetical protein
MKSIYCVRYENKISFDGMNVWKYFFNYNKHNIKHNIKILFSNLFEHRFTNS